MINHCVYDKISCCHACDLPKEQKKCRHYDKARFLERCMYLRFDKYCDSLKAQNDRDGLLSDEQVAEAEQSQVGATK
jgi:hypothetical protein